MLDFEVICAMIVLNAGLTYYIVTVNKSNH